MAEGTRDNQILLLHGVKDLRLETQPLPPPSFTEVQISISSTGICGSDLHYYAAGRNGDFIVRQPLCLGHESSGTVVAVPSSTECPPSSSSAAMLNVGDRVALEVGLPCKVCSLCISGRYNICPRLVFRSSAKVFPHSHGTLTERVNHAADMSHRLPSNVSFEEGALAEPLAVCLHAIRRSGIGEMPLGAGSVLVLGAGAIGLLTAAALAAATGVSRVVVADIDEARLGIARALGFGAIDTFLLPMNTPKGKVEDTLADSKAASLSVQASMNGGGGFDRVFECTGVANCVQMGIFASNPGGKVVLVGMGNSVQTLPIGAASLREVDIVGVFRYAGEYPAAISLLAGKLKGVREKLVTHRVALKDAKEGFDLALKGKDEDGKPVLKVMIGSGE